MQETERRLSYSVGMKVNLGNYESGDVHVSESRQWSVEGPDEELDVEEIDRQYAEMRERVDDKLLAVVGELRGQE